MPATVSGDFLFDPKVWADHVTAYFDRKLVYGAFAIRDNTLQAEGSGLTVNFPFYNKIGAAEEPAETSSLTVDNLSDDSFNATVFEAGKAVGIKDKAFKKSAATGRDIIDEAQVEIGRVMQEKVDQKLSDEITTLANYEDVTPVVTPATMDIRVLNKARIQAFGDKFQDGEVCFMHSLVYLDLINDTNAGFLKMDANDPAALVDGFMGRFLGMAIVVVDTVPTGLGVGNDEYLTHFHKMASFGIMSKQEMSAESDRDILARENIYTSTQWYAVKSFHKKVSTDDKRAGAVRTKVS